MFPSGVAVRVVNTKMSLRAGCFPTGGQKGQVLQAEDGVATGMTGIMTIKPLEWRCYKLAYAIRICHFIQVLIAGQTEIPTVQISSQPYDFPAVRLHTDD